LSASASSHRDLSLAVFITNIAESDFRYTQGEFSTGALAFPGDRGDRWGNATSEDPSVRCEIGGLIEFFARNATAAWGNEVAREAAE
jgi:hypothetical protein